MKELIEGGLWQMILGILFTGGFVGALVAWAVLRIRDRRSYADEMPTRPQRDDMEEESQRNAR